MKWLFPNGIFAPALLPGMQAFGQIVPKRGIDNQSPGSITCRIGITFFRGSGEITIIAPART